MSPRSEEQYQDIRDSRKNQILDAALRVFAKRGLTAAKITDISSEANLSHGLVHHYFKSKEEIFIEVTRQTIKKSSAAFAKIANLEGSPLEILKIITERNILTIDAEENALRWLFMINLTISDVVPQEAKLLSAASYTPLNAITELIRKGQSLGEIAGGDPERLMIAYWAMIQGLILFRYNKELNPPMPEIDTVLRMLKP
jgi:AcrR family transcriptional regulator